MSLNLFVPCNCYKEGLCSEPPVDKSLIIYDENDYILSLKLEYKGNENLYLKFDSWLENCCEHENRDYFIDCLGSNHMIGIILDFLEICGNNFNMVFKAFNSSGYSITTEEAKMILNQLEKIKSENDLINLANKHNDYYTKYASSFYEMITILKKVAWHL